MGLNERQSQWFAHDQILMNSPGALHSFPLHLELAYSLLLDRTRDLVRYEILIDTATSRLLPKSVMEDRNTHQLVEQKALESRGLVRERVLFEDLPLVYPETHFCCSV